MDEDGVNRQGLDYRAGYVEALASVLHLIHAVTLRCPKKGVDAMSQTFDAVQKARNGILDKMKGENA